MASSPLFGQAVNPNLTLASLLAGQNQMQDPAVAAFGPRLQLSQAMLQQGLDSSPTSGRLGGLSRLASALAGLYGMNQATEGLNDISKRYATDAADIGRQWSAPLSSTLSAPAPQAAAASAPAATSDAAPQMPVQSAPLPAAVHQLESGGSMAPGIRGDGGAAAGPMQVHQAALDDVNKAQGTNYTLDQLAADPKIGKQVGDAYLAQMQARFPGRPDLAMAAYNAGPTATQAAVSGGQGLAGLPQSTQNYVARGTQFAGPGAPTGGATPAVTPAPVGTAQGGAPQGGGVPPAVTPAQGGQPQQQSDIVAQAVRMRDQARAVQNDPKYRYNTILQDMAKRHLEDAEFMLQLPHTYTDVPGGQRDAITNKREYAPVHTATDSAGNLLSIGTDGAPHIIAPVDTAGAGALKKAEAGGTAAGGGDWVAGNQNGVPGQINRVTGEFKPTVTAAPRLMQTPSGAVVASMPGTGDVKEVVPASNSGVAERAAAGSQGEQAGKTATTVPQLAKVLHEAVQTKGTIDSATSQLASASAGGVPTGYFGPVWAHGLAALKSAGVDTAKLGVDPSAIGDIQAGRKSLALVAGGIMRQILGPDSQITEGKLDQFIHATPGIETDPGALTKILAWAKSQAVYNENMAMHGLRSADPHTGIIPAGWQSQYLVNNGGGPIYDPITGEMRQQNEPPKAAAPAQAAPQHSRADLEAEARKRGLKY